MIGDEAWFDVHAAIATGRLNGVALLAVQWPAVKELFQPGTFGVAEMHQVSGQSDSLATDIAFPFVAFLKDG